MGPTGQEACGAAVPAFAVHSHLSDKMSITSTIIIVAVVSALQSELNFSYRYCYFCYYYHYTSSDESVLVIMITIVDIIVIIIIFYMALDESMTPLQLMQNSMSFQEGKVHGFYQIFQGIPKVRTTIDLESNLIPWVWVSLKRGKGFHVQSEKRRGPSSCPGSKGMQRRARRHMVLWTAEKPVVRSASSLEQPRWKVPVYLRCFRRRPWVVQALERETKRTDRKDQKRCRQVFEEARQWEARETPCSTGGRWNSGMG